MGKGCCEKIALFVIFTTVACWNFKESHSHLAPLVSSRHQRGLTETDLVDRVARVPSIRSPDELDYSLFKMGSLKSPGFHMRNRPLKINYNVHSPHSSENSPSETTEPSTKRRISDLDVSQDESFDMSDGESPTFTPYIGAHALSNMEKFFEHLRENLEAIQSDGTGEIDQPERRRMTSGEAPASSERMHTHEVNSSPEGRFPPAMALQVQPQPSITYRERSFHLPSNRAIQKMQTFIQPLTEEEAYLRKANNYNPSWLWTNLGLGRKRRR